jgi:RimJ/RimL family protein N-acetyltransferase
VSEPTPVEDGFRRVPSPFEGALVRLRAVEEDDIPAIHRMFNDPEVQRTLAFNWLEPVAGTWRWWEGVRANAATAAFVIETLAGKLVGACSLEDVNVPVRSAALGIWIGKDHWDKGYGTDAVRTLCRFGFREMNLQRIGLSVYEVNPRGVRAYEKVGFKEEGRARRAHFIDGRYVDVVRMGLLAEELAEADPAG